MNVGRLVYDGQLFVSIIFVGVECQCVVFDVVFFVEGDCVGDVFVVGCFGQYWQVFGWFGGVGFDYGCSYYIDGVIYVGGVDLYVDVEFVFEFGFEVVY